MQFKYVTEGDAQVAVLAETGAVPADVSTPAATSAKAPAATPVAAGPTVTTATV